MIFLPLIVNDPAADLEGIEGRWIATSWISEGKDHGPDGDIRLEVEGDTFTWHFRKSSMETKVSNFDPTQDPKVVDLTRERDQQAIKGIYKLEEDTLNHLHDFRGRPTDFAAEAGSRRLLRVLKRSDSK